jgi:hypothetical protein
LQLGLQSESWFLYVPRILRFMTRFFINPCCRARINTTTTAVD